MLPSSPISELEADPGLAGRSLEERRVGRIPLRNIWLLMLYASDIARFAGRSDILLERDIDELPDLVGRLLVRETERRMRRGLSRGYQHRDAILTRVRGRIDLLATFTQRLFDRGEVACRFDELTLDTPRNRFVRAALRHVEHLVRDRDLALQCRSLAGDLGRAGVSGGPPARAELAKDQVGRNDAEDRFLLALARLAFDLALPTEDAGTTPLTTPARDEYWVRRLFERAVAGFYSVELSARGWGVRSGVRLHWAIAAPSKGIRAILPSMKADIVLDAPAGRRIVIDTKFAAIVGKGWYREESLTSGYLYQIYAYLRSQERPGDASSPWNHAAGILLHPAIDKGFDESVTIQGHEMRFVTIDLSDGHQAIRSALRDIALSMTEVRSGSPE